MRKLILSATIVASSFLSYAQWRGVDNFGELREGVKAIKYSNKKQAMKKASDLFYTMGYSSDISHMYINKNVPVLGYFVEDGCKVTKYEETIVQIYIDKWNLS